MKIAHITDLHIDHAGEKPFEIDVRRNFLKVLSAAKKDGAEHLVITGDLCYRTGEEDIYTWIYGQLESCGTPYEIIPGNHDDTEMMAHIFERSHLLTEDEFYYARKIGKRSCIFLDSSKGSHSDNQLKWLERQLKNAADDALLFMHHPPALAGVAYMDDNYALQDAAAVQQVFQKHPANVLAFCGHYHVDRILISENIIVHITPSCFFQIDSRVEGFKVDHHRVGYRMIEDEGRWVRSEVRYY